MNSGDRVRLRHMLDSAREAISLADGRSRTDLDSNRMFFHSFVRNMEIIGEAASQVSKALRDARSGLPWADVIGMRNRLIHAYFDIDPEIIWDTVTQDLPLLVAALTELVAEGRSNPEDGIRYSQSAMPPRQDLKRIIEYLKALGSVRLEALELQRFTDGTSGVEALVPEIYGLPERPTLGRVARAWNWESFAEDATKRQLGSEQIKGIKEFHDQLQTVLHADIKWVAGAPLRLVRS